MDPYAIVETGGKQYLVRSGDTVAVEKLDAEPGGRVEFDRVLAVSDGRKLSVGTPAVENARVAATVVEHTRGPKVTSFKKKRRKGYSRKVGHRQELTLIRIDEVG